MEVGATVPSRGKQQVQRFESKTRLGSVNYSAACQSLDARIKTAIGDGRQ